MEVDPPAGPQAQAAGLKAGEEAARRATHLAVRRLFLRLLAVVYLLAFGSLAVQMQGLVGSGGVLPVGVLLDWARSHYGVERYWLLPTLCWLSSSDGFLRGLCWGGALLSVLLFLELAPLLVLLLLWAFYLSLVTAGQVFLGYQWDALLLEAGLLAMFLAPPGLRPRLTGEGRVPAHALWLLRWLLFRLMFSSGVVKLRSGDEAWRGLTALRFHYETQPLPTLLAWYAHQLPGWFHSLSTLVMFGVELLAPLLIFAPRRLRLGACAAMAALQVLIAATGNYGFFNLLTLALCVLLLDDQALPRRWRDRGEAATLPHARFSRRARTTLAGAFFVLSGVVFSGTLGLRIPWPEPVLQLLDVASSFRSINGYGLFAVMTTSRPEIVVEGSADGVTWLPYGFKWKPVDPRRPPGFVAPHQPRLDWQMWFAALSTCDRNPWFVQFLGRLLQGSPEVLGLLAGDPFPGKPPRQVRAVLYEYHFSDSGTRREDGAWWRRRPLGLYCPVLSLTAAEPPGASGRSDRLSDDAGASSTGEESAH